MPYTQAELIRMNADVCDICGLLAVDSLSDRCKSEGVEKLCHECAYQIYTLEKELMIMFCSNKELRFDRFELIKAKAICMKAGLSMSIKEPLIGKRKFDINLITKKLLCIFQK